MQNFWVELIVRGVVLCLLTAITLVLSRRTAAAYRHLICLLGLCGLLTLPLAQRLVPPLPLLTPQSASTPQQVSVSTDETSRLTGGNSISELPPSLRMPQQQSVRTKSDPLIPPDSIPIPRKGASMDAVLIAIWGIGTATLLIRLLVALLRLRRLEAQSRKVLLGSVPIRISEQIQTPLTWGIRRSVIVLPAALLSAEQAVCESALRHEQAHIARWDWMWNLLAELVCALCWFQPGAWWLRARLRLESERACDDRVLLSGVAGPDYAAHLVQILRSVGSNEVAPAMAQSRGMEARMRHILDTAKPRRASTKGLIASAPLALALLSLAALRVSARPAAAHHPTDGRTATVNPRVASFRPSKSADPAAKPATTYRADGPQDNVSSAVRLEEVTWGKGVDGLEPGFLLTTPGLARNRRVLLNSHVDYQVLVRNITDRERFIEVRRGGSDPWVTAPYFIPNADLRDALRSRIVPERFRAEGVLELSEIVPAYDVKLAAGEAIIVPQVWPFGARGLYLGDADKESFPRMEAVKIGMNWIVQPITIHPLSASEQADVERMNETSDATKTVMTTLDRDGKSRQRSVRLVGAQNGGKQLYAMIQLEVGSSDAPAVRSSEGGQKPPGAGAAPSQPPAAPTTLQRGDASPPAAAPSQEPADIVWGPGREVQAGLRVRLWATDQHAGRFIFDVFLRNRTKHTLNVTCPSYPGLTVPTDGLYTTLIQSELIYCTPHLRDSNGRRVDVGFRLGSDDRQYTLEPGQGVEVSHWMLRTMDRGAQGTARANYTLVALVAPGMHRMSCDVSASWDSKGGRRTLLRTGEVAFDVTEADVGAE